MLRLAAVLIPLAQVAPAQDCLPAINNPDSSYTEIKRFAPCYRLDVPAGVRTRIWVIEGDGITFSVDGLIEGQDDYAFVTEPDAGDTVYRIRLNSEARAADGEPFTIRITRSDGAHPIVGAWRVQDGEGRAGGLAWIGEEGGPALTLGCSAETGRLHMTYDGFGTVALTRDDAESAEAVLEIDADDGARRHPVTLRRYDGFDRYWEVSEGLTEAFLDDFAAGARMRLLDAEGASAGEVALSGSAAVREAMARRCGL